MNLHDSNLTKRSVRLFPRLATAVPMMETAFVRGKIAARTSTPPPSADAITSVRAEVKARLLKMILENERVRRNERRPSQA
jgi:hypothetical protein